MPEISDTTLSTLLSKVDTLQDQLTTVANAVATLTLSLASSSSSTAPDDRRPTVTKVDPKRAKLSFTSVKDQPNAYSVVVSKQYFETVIASFPDLGYNRWVPVKNQANTSLDSVFFVDREDKSGFISMFTAEARKEAMIGEHSDYVVGVTVKPDEYLFELYRPSVYDRKSKEATKWHYALPQVATLLYDTFRDPSRCPQPDSFTQVIRRFKQCLLPNYDISPNNGNGGNKSKRYSSLIPTPFEPSVKRELVKALHHWRMNDLHTQWSCVTNLFENEVFLGQDIAVAEGGARYIEREYRSFYVAKFGTRGLSCGECSSESLDDLAWRAVDREISGWCQVFPKDGPVYNQWLKFRLENFDRPSDIVLVESLLHHLHNKKSEVVYTNRGEAHKNYYRLTVNDKDLVADMVLVFLERRKKAVDSFHEEMWIVSKQKQLAPEFNNSFVSSQISEMVQLFELVCTKVSEPSNSVPPSDSFKVIVERAVQYLVTFVSKAQPHLTLVDRDEIVQSVLQLMKQHVASMDVKRKWWIDNFINRLKTDSFTLDTNVKVLPGPSLKFVWDSPKLKEYLGGEDTTQPSFTNEELVEDLVRYINTSDMTKEYTNVNEAHKNYYSTKTGVLVFLKTVTPCNSFSEDTFFVAKNKCKGKIGCSSANLLPTICSKAASSTTIDDLDVHVKRIIRCLVLHVQHSSLSATEQDDIVQCILQLMKQQPAGVKPEWWLNRFINPLAVGSYTSDILGTNVKVNPGPALKFLWYSDKLIEFVGGSTALSVATLLKHLIDAEVKPPCLYSNVHEAHKNHYYVSNKAYLFMFLKPASGVCSDWTMCRDNSLTEDLFLAYVYTFNYDKVEMIRDYGELTRELLDSIYADDRVDLKTLVERAIRCLNALSLKYFLSKNEKDDIVEKLLKFMQKHADVKPEWWFANLINPLKNDKYWTCTKQYMQYVWDSPKIKEYLGGTDDDVEMKTSDNELVARQLDDGNIPTFLLDHLVAHVTKECGHAYCNLNDASKNFYYLHQEDINKHYIIVFLKKAATDNTSFTEDLWVSSWCKNSKWPGMYKVSSRDVCTRAIRFIPSICFNSSSKDLKVVTERIIRCLVSWQMVGADNSISPDGKTAIIEGLLHLIQTHPQPLWWMNNFFNPIKYNTFTVDDNLKVQLSHYSHFLSEIWKHDKMKTLLTSNTNRSEYRKLLNDTLVLNNTEDHVAIISDQAHGACAVAITYRENLADRFRGTEQGNESSIFKDVQIFTITHENAFVTNTSLLQHSDLYKLRDKHTFDSMILNALTWMVTKMPTFFDRMNRQYNSSWLMKLVALTLLSDSSTLTSEGLQTKDLLDHVNYERVVTLHELVDVLPKIGPMWKQLYDTVKLELTYVGNSTSIVSCSCKDYLERYFFSMYDQEFNLGCPVPYQELDIRSKFKGVGVVMDRLEMLLTKAEVEKKPTPTVLDTISCFPRVLPCNPFDKDVNWVFKTSNVWNMHCFQRNPTSGQLNLYLKASALCDGDQSHHVVDVLNLTQKNERSPKLLKNIESILSCAHGQLVSTTKPIEVTPVFLKDCLEHMLLLLKVYAHYWYEYANMSTVSWPQATMSNEARNHALNVLQKLMQASLCATAGDMPLIKSTWRGFLLDLLRIHEEKAVSGKTYKYMYDDIRFLLLKFVALYNTEVFDVKSLLDRKHDEKGQLLSPRGSTLLQIVQYQHSRDNFYTLQQLSTGKFKYTGSVVDAFIMPEKNPMSIETINRFIQVAGTEAYEEALEKLWDHGLSTLSWHQVRCMMRLIGSRAPGDKLRRSLSEFFALIAIVDVEELDGPAYRKEVQLLLEWCTKNNVGIETVLQAQLKNKKMKA